MSDNVMHDLFEKPQRKGSSGRVPDKMIDSYEKYRRINISIQPDLDDRLIEYCNEEERAKSWVIQKALDKWLKERGF